MFTNVMLIAVLALLVIELGVIFYHVKYLSFFLQQIRTVKGVNVRTLDIGNPAPLFRVFDEDGRRVILKDLYREKKTLLLFIKTGCPNCKLLLPHLMEILEHYDLHLLVINSENVEDDHEIKSLLDEEITYIRGPQIVQSYFLNGFPHAVLIDTEGNVEANNHVFNEKALWNILINQKSLVS